MLLLDRIIEHDETGTCCELTIGAHSMFRQECGEIPAWVGLEYMAQAMAAHVGMEARKRREPVFIGLLLGTRRLKLHIAAFADGCTLRAHAEPSWQDNQLTSFACRLTDADSGTLLAEAQLNAYRPPEIGSASEEAPS